MNLKFYIDTTSLEKEFILELVDLSIKTTPLNESTLLSNVSPQEKELILLLINEEKTFKRAPNQSFNRIRVRPSQFKKVLQLLAGSGKLFCKQTKLIVDFFGKTTPVFHIEKTDEAIITLSLYYNNKPIDVTELEYIGFGPPAWYIHGMFLRFIDCDISWKYLKKFYKNSTLKLPHHELDEFIEDVQEGNGDIIRFTGEKHSNPDPLPSLKLKDPRGMFADLWIAYTPSDSVPFHDSKAQLKSKTSRNLVVEKGYENDLLETQYIQKTVDQSHYYCPIDKVGKSIAFLLEMGWNVYDYKGQRIVKNSGIDLHSTIESNHIITKGKIHFDKYHADLKQVVGAFNKRERFLQIGENTVGLLPDAWQDSTMQTLCEECEIIGGELAVSRHKIDLFREIEKQQIGWTLDASLKKLADDHAVKKSYLPDEKFKGFLRPYQLEGLNWLMFLHQFEFSGILADDMGLGKTVQVLAYLSLIKSKNPVLIVVPSSIIFNWRKEIERFLPKTPVSVYHGPERHLEDNYPQGQILITTYTTLRIDQSILKQKQFNCIILDESQQIKNPQTQIAQAIFSLNASQRLSITGTPVENTITELWSQFQFLMPDMLDDYEKFVRGVQDPRYLQKIKKKITPFILRRTKEEVVKDLPEKIEQVVWTNFEEDQRTLYENFLAGVKGQLLKKIEVDGVSNHRMEILEAILRLRQICCHPLLVSSQIEGNIFPSVKFDALFDDLETLILEGRKGIVYSQFTSMLGIMRKEAQNRGWKFVNLDGTTQNREQVVTQFQEDKETSLFFISLKAGGVGLNLTAADAVFIFEPWWNLAVEEQAIARAHRIGRKGPVVAKRYVVSGTIEERMMKLKEKKRELFDHLFDDNSNFTITIDDLKDLLMKEDCSL
jgi:SNF2 family DNA or RNA helicase